MLKRIGHLLIRQNRNILHLVLRTIFDPNSPHSVPRVNGRPQAAERGRHGGLDVHDGQRRDAVRGLHRGRVHRQEDGGRRRQVLRRHGLGICECHEAMGIKDGMRSFVPWWTIFTFHSISPNLWGKVLTHHR